MRHLYASKLAELSGIGKETLRYYESIGLISPPPRSTSGYRKYPENTLERLLFIKRAQGLGFALKEIQELLSLEDQPSSTAGPVRAIAVHKLREIEDKIRDLQSLKAVLLDLTNKCSGVSSISECPIMESLSHGTGIEEHKQ